MRKIISVNGIKISGVTSDSRKVKPGYAFIAINGFAENGNKYISHAIEKGAIVIYTEEEPEKSYNVPIHIVDNARQKEANLAAELYKNPSKKLKLVGITGTNGKTTTSYLIHHLLSGKDDKVGLLGTIEYKLGSHSTSSKLTTPEASYTQYFLNEVLESGGKSAVMEVSSHGVKLRRVDYLDFDVAVFTNLTPDHYDLHPDFQDYLQTKKQWFDNLKEEAVIFYNWDDPFHREVIGASSAKSKIGFSIEGKGDINGKEINYSTNGLNMIIESQRGKQIKASVPILGKHNCYNVLAAVAVCSSLGLSNDEIEERLNSFPGIWRRCELIWQEPYGVIDDATHNPQNFRAVFEMAKELPKRRIHALVGIRGNRGWRINYENALTVAKHASQLNVQLTVTKSLDTNGPHDKLVQAEEDAFTKGLWEGGADFRMEETLKGGLESAIKELEPGDLLLLLGAHPFDNVREMAISLLEQQAKGIDVQDIHQDHPLPETLDESRRLM
ncbi:UDP-N-acetylmuramoyl-L-alanyl-D-glutamate--2,6-diaminopimelate ligase [Desulfitispora alkaliphila]|uniref:Mur ligase family protein n=1 Tax=Desulfitispora alkaliphila TaxID=622674 RepID=UPI003D19579E